MKKILVLVMAFFSLFLLTVPASAASAGTAPNGIVINGYQLTSNLAPVVQDGQVYLPLRSVATALGTTVTWNGTTQTATITKNGMVLLVNLTNHSITLDGQVFTGSPLVENSGILVPATVLEKALGATVSLDSVSGNVYINYQETVDGMTPEQLLLKSAAAGKAAGTYKFNETVTLQTYGPGQSMTLPMQMQGMVQEPGQAYIVSTTSLPGQGMTKSESYTDNGKIYIRMNGGTWQQMPISAYLSNLQQQLGNDPSASVNMIKQIGGIISSLSPETVDGTTYDVVRVTIDPTMFKQWLANLMVGMTPPGENQAQVQKAMQGILGVMQIKDFAYEMYIDPQTYLMRQGYLTMEMTINMPPSPVSMDEHGTFSMYGYGQPVQMPTIPAGQ